MPEYEISLSTSTINNDSRNNSSISENDVVKDRYNTLPFMFTNCRSLSPKIGSLVEMFDELQLYFAALSETWLSNGGRFDKDRKKLEDRDELVMITKNRKTRGGGVAIVFDKRKINLKQVKMGGGDLEVVGAVGRTLTESRRILVISAYYPPAMRRENVDRLNQCISDTIDRQKIAHEGLRVVVCGDMNKKDVVPILTDHPDVHVLQTPPTRHAETIDLCLTNVGEEFVSAECHQPLESRDGRRSDHNTMVCTIKQPKVHIFEKRVIKTRMYNETREASFGADLACVDWADIHLLNADQAAVHMTAVLSGLYDKHFPVHTRTIKSSDPPWMTNGVRKIVRKKRKRYRKHKKDRGWKILEQAAKEETYKAKTGFLGKVRERVFSSGNSGDFFKAINCLKSKDAPRPWDISTLMPGLSDEDIANKCVDFFSEISREYQPLGEPVPDPASQGDWSIALHEISARLKHCRKPKSGVKGDIDPRLVTKFCDLIAIPLHCIYNKVLRDYQWPEIWKRETVKIIPKKSIPESLKDVRNISCTPLFSKVLEHFVLVKLRSVMKLSNEQFGGVKGVGIDHFLCETWHEVLTTLDDNSAAASLTSIDFSKAFNRMDHNACLNALRDAGVPSNVIGVVHAFLYGRTMQVHIRDSVSRVQAAPGGAPQGSVLGSHLFCATTDRLGKSHEEQHPESTLSFEANGIDASISIDSLPTTNSPIRHPFRASTPVNIQLLDNEWDGDSDEEINFGIRGPIRRLLDTTVPSFLPSQSELEDALELDHWDRRKPTVKAYIDDYNVLEKVRTTAAVSHFTAGRATATTANKVQFAHVVAEIPQTVRNVSG